MLQYQLWKKLVVAVVLIGGIVYSLPNLVSDQMTSILPGKKINLGLDLSGGSHLLLRVDIDAVRKNALTRSQKLFGRSSAVPKSALAGLIYLTIM